ncbi:DNA replication complex GINS family protein [Thermococcus aciditolerans]|uniref:DNA replication complex GINS family protein n=1 Tax=Thermococcus aciditolerans TaxID=2598455 RepID=A0A5C0SK03_9EURY|nr:DNA replication complex GINS family protein [Thermococcus aciditolerans]QEK14825.1 DNA replication complex GINS family protein [Thermococcus aciditolerans]
MFTGRAVIPVKILRPFGDWSAGDVVLIEDWKAKELWEAKVVEVIDEADKVIGEIDRAIAEERESEPLTSLPAGLYERAEFYMYYLENYVRLNAGESIETINIKLTKLANLKKKLEHLKQIRFRKILEAVRLRPNSLELLSRLSPEERRIYLQLSKIRNEWLGEE